MAFSLVPIHGATEEASRCSIIAAGCHGVSVMVKE